MLLKDSIVLILLLLFLGINASLIHAQNIAPMKKSKEIPCLFIHKIVINTKSQRTSHNPPALYRYALIRGCAKNENEQRSAVQILGLTWENTKMNFGIYDIKQVFNTSEEANAYALMNNIPITSERKGFEIVLQHVPSLRENGGILPQDIKIDIVIQDIEKSLPSDWELLQTDEDKSAYPQHFTLRAKYEVWETRENLINAPAKVIEKINNPIYYTKKGKKITPFIRFALHQPWRKIELDNIEYNEQNWQYFYTNAQYFGLKVTDIAGIENQFIQIHLPDNVQVSPFQVYDKMYQLLKPKTVIGTAQRNKLGDLLEAENGNMYYIDNKYSVWKTWKDEEIGKKVKITATVITKESNLPTHNENGEMQQGMEDNIFYLIRPQREIYEQEITIVGKLQVLQKSKKNAQIEENQYVIIADNRETYELEGIGKWYLIDDFLDKRMIIKGIYTEKPYPTLVDLKLPELKKSSSLVVVFKKDIAKESSLRIMQYTDYPFWEGMAGSKGKVYFYQTGEKYHIIFPSEEELQNCLDYLKNKSEIYEVYPPYWDINKD